MNNGELYKAISQQLVRMLARNLDRAPQAEELPLCIQVLCDDLMNCGYTDADATRVAGAIDKYGRDADVWPNTKRIQDTLRGTAYWKAMDISGLPALPEPDEIKLRGKETGLKNLRHIRDILGPYVEEKVNGRSCPNPKYILNDTEHEKLIKENSIEGELYREMMGHPEPASLQFDDLEDKALFP